ncbi:MAG: ROK family protein, partial [Bacteroidales bacterium]|nr:ROK family protein [Bacteroidales bacterium]
MNYKDDKRIVLTLDAGGTNFIFSAVQGDSEIIEPVNLSAKGNDLKIILKNIISGFKQIESKINHKPVAISFSFPGPTDYKNGIIGNLENLPAFHGGVALKAMLENEFQIPVFINNDGDLFTFGEAIAGILSEINSLLE